MNVEFGGRTVIVTGAVRGIGRGIAHAFAARGARVLACDVLADGLAETIATAQPMHGGSIEASTLDVTDSQAVAELVSDAESATASRSVDVLVHSAGGVLGQVSKPLEEVSDEEWRAVQAVNLDGAFHTARAVAPGMKRAGRGRIVVIASRAGLGVSLTGIASYGTAKTAQIGLVRQLAHELGPFGVTVNAVAPGFMRTSPDYERQWQSYGEAGQRALLERVAMRRVGQPDDIAHATLFLASDFASWITGQTLAVTGSP